jgi:4-hydroxy-2-oxoheptanedioate aldolase
LLEKNRVKEKILGGEKVVGTFCNLGSTAVVEILGQLGFDFVIIDTEHGPGAVESAVALIMAAEVRGLPPFVRVKEADRNSILRMLDIGAMGLLIPFVKSLAEVRKIVAYGKYRPVGDRGFGLTRKNCFGLEPLMADRMEAYFEWANENTLLIPQCETVECLEQIEDIVALEGVDGIFIGPYDLSIAMGIPGQFHHPDLVAAMNRVLEACKRAGKFCLTMGVTAEEAKRRFEEGYDGAVTVDASLLAAGVMGHLNGIKKYGY